MIFCLFITLIPSLQSQDPSEQSYLDVKENAEERYGPIAELVNGEKYNFTYRASGGDPFFETDVSDKAVVQINGRIYTDQNVRYDIYNQLMVLEFASGSGATESVVLKNEWLDYVLIGDRLFRQFPEDDGSPRFAQVINEGRYSCIYFWEKRYLPNLDAGGKSYYFSEPIRRSYVVEAGIVTPFNSKRSFLKCFPKQNKPAIKQKIKEQRIRFRKAGDKEMALLMKFINQIPGNED
jgi:hypothetical protein